MKTNLLTIPLIFAFSFAASAMEFSFESTTDYDAALDEAEKEDKPVLLAFVAETCGHCQALKRNVFGTRKFAEYAEENLVPLVYDFNHVDQLSPESRRQLKRLTRKHHVNSTPTILLLKPDGSVILKSAGYGGSDVDEVISLFDRRIAAKTSLL